MPVLAPLVVQVVPATPAASTALQVSVVVPGASPAKWRAVVLLGGMDISARLTGVIEVEATEGAARIAEFSMVPPAGVVTPPDWVGQRVTIDFAEAGSAGQAINAQRVFTGVVDVPIYDVSTGLATFECTDQRQEVIANTPRTWLATNIGGYYSEAVSGPAADNLQYAQARLASVPAALDLDVFQRPRVTPWAAATPYTTLSEADVLDGSLGVSMASRADLRNTVEVSFEYRYPRLRSRTLVSEWYVDGDYRAKDLATKSMVEQALTGLSGWQLDGSILYVQAPSGSQSWNGGIYYLSPEVASLTCIGWSAVHRSRWVQTVTERSTITVSNAASVAAIGQARETLTGATLQAEYDASGWLGNYSAAPLPATGVAGDSAYDFGETGVSDRNAANAAMEVLVAQAQTRVQETHRGARVNFSVPLRADYDLIHTHAIDATLADGRRVRAIGKTHGLAHVMDLDAGEATTAVSLAISGHASVGVQPYTPPSALAQPSDPSPAPDPGAFHVTASTYAGYTTGALAYDADTMIGFACNRVADDALGTYDPFGEVYPHQFSVRAPDIEATALDPLELTSSGSFAVDVPQDLFEVTAS